jgi:hypothetical protein
MILSTRCQPLDLDPFQDQLHIGLVTVDWDLINKNTERRAGVLQHNAFF